MPLLQALRQGRPGASARSRASRQDSLALSAELPVLQPRIFPLDADACSTLRGLADTHNSHRYQHHIAKSMGLLKNSVGDVNILLIDLKSEVGKREEASQHVRSRVAKVESEVEDLTRRAEEGTRCLIDMGVEMEDEKALFQELAELVSQEQPRPEPQPKPKHEAAKKRRSTVNEDEDVDEAGMELDVAEADQGLETHGVDKAQKLFRGVCELLKDTRQRKNDEYQRLGAYERYALNNDYTSFKKDWHMGMYPDGDPPIPDKRAWFDDQGRPKAGGENGDDDLAITGAVFDPKCPLSMTIMTEPYGSTECPHVFQKESITEFLQTNGGSATCPVPGCDRTLTMREMALDEAVLLRLKRAEGMARRARDDEPDSEADGDGMAM